MRQSLSHLLSRPALGRAGLLGALLFWAAPGMSQITSSAGEPVGALCPPETHAPLPRVEGDSTDLRTHVESDRADIRLEGTSVFQGDVVIIRGLNQLDADRAEYDRQQDTVHAEGDVRLLRNDLLVTGEEADMDMSTHTGQITASTYRTGENQQGRAGTIRILDEYRTEFEDATYTTCDPDDPDWLLSAGHIILNEENRQGAARNVTVSFKGVPFLYLPYMRFPIGDERLSGLLYPSVGGSDQHGDRIVVPYYWNIAPQMDATITLDYMSRRGLMLKNEFRYLTSATTGQVDWHYLADDKVYGADRERFRWQHEGSAGLGWSSQVDYNYVADTDHLFDFGDDLNATSTTHLERRGELAYNAEQWRFTALAQSHQVIRGNEAYQRLPQLGFSSRLPQPDNALNYNVDAQWVNFDHRGNRVVGERLDLAPSVSLPLRKVYGFAEPKLQLRHSQYDLDPATTTGETGPTRTVPIFSLNSGLFFERDTRIGGTDLLHTLEPQLFYAYIPYRDQQDLPVFDTSLRGFTINDPFRANRFEGVDRVGDTNHLTAALTTRLLSQQTGNELLMARLAQIFYFDDRRVTLGNDSLDESRRSDIIAELDARPNARWAFDSDLTWSPESEKITTANTRLRYSPLDTLSLSVAYRFQRDRLETNEAGFDWRLNPSWQFHGRRLYDQENQRELESVLGLRYDSCCWGLNLEARRRFISNDRPEENALMLILELKGLASFGQQTSFGPQQ
ncbi:LPS-assembly protein LptD [Thiohalophilus thiocyanatoxydans]|uniref:LPS-assembly protein LptD n=1 Tax=Thiohalophilus thiocyanatoxydans TaxID=381308 RepID=A0A4R8J373_9GAMM|nr:LPS-assembly protein LptD [Thiohalophilus thiocyanatoxydans]TDY04323.1 LPS-assembly protein [Thiohalophilus thiocyanatoxydans]